MTEAEKGTTATDRIVAEIRKAIVAGELGPGDQLLTVPELAAQYEVSHNTARQALAVLASQGLLNVKRGVAGGSFVTVPSHEYISESWQTNIALLTGSADLPVSALLEMREALEVPAAEMAALRGTETEFAAIEAALFDPASRRAEQILNSNRRFHSGLLRAAHNPLFELVAEPIRLVLQDRLIRQHASRPFWRQVDRDHREILAYLRTRDQAGAREATRAHLRALRSTYEHLDRARD